MSKQNGRRRPSKEQARAWLSTVIAPLWAGLRVEVKKAARGDWTFRAGMRDFEFLWPTDMMVAEKFRPNFVRVRRYFPKVEQACERHDESLAALRDVRCRALDGLLEDQTFRALVEIVDSDPQSHLAAFASYVVNGFERVDDSFISAEVWNSRSAEFLAIGNAPSLRGTFGESGRVGAAFFDAASRLAAVVSRLQRQLAERFRLPPVDPSDAMSA